MKGKRYKYNAAAVMNKQQRRSLRRYAPIFLFPTVIAFAIGFVWPFLQGIYLSFFRFRTLRNITFTGLSNYKSAFLDPQFFRSFLFTVGFTVVSVLIINVAAFLIALALTRNTSGSTLCRTVFFMPNLIGGIVLGWIWQVIINGILYTQGVTIVSDPKYGFWGLVVLMNWQNVGYMMVIYIAAIQNIPSDMLEAAAIDGANYPTILRKIIIPTVMPSITICLFMTVTNGFKLFDQNLALTAGEPGKQTEMLALNIYNTFY